MAERQAPFRVGYIEDEASRKKVIKGMQDISKSAVKLAEANKQVASTADKANKELDELGKRKANIDRITSAFKQAADAGDNTFQAADKAARALDRIGASSGEIARAKQELKLTTEQARQLDTALSSVAANEKFSFTSQRVALAGDVQSNLGAVRGLAGSAGLGGASGAIGVGGELIVLTEELPRLKTALAGMPQTIKAAAGELGAGGVGLIGALAALAATTTIARKEFNDAAKGIRSTIDAQKSAFELARTGTADEIAERKSAVEAQLQLQKEYLNAIEDDYANLIENSKDKLGGALTDVLEFTSTNIGIGSGSLAEYNKQIEEQRNIVSGLSTEMNALNGALDDSALSANAAALAQKEYSDQLRADFITNEIALAKERSQAQIEANELIAESDKEGIQSRIADYQRELAVAQATFDDLTRTLADTGLSDQERQQIIDARSVQEQYILNINQLIPIFESAEQRAGALGEAVSKFGTSSEKATQDVQSLGDVMREQGKKNIIELNKLNQQAADSSQKSADKILDIRRDLANKEADLLLKLNQSLADARTKAAQARQDLDRKQSEALLDAEQDYRDEQAKIIRDAQRDLRTAIGDRDVLGFRQARESRDDALDDAKTSFDKQRRELQINYERQLREIQIGLQRQENELRIGYNRQLQATQQAAQRQIQLEQQRLSAEANLRAQAYRQMLSLEQTFAQQSIGIMQNLASSAANLSNSIAQNFAASGASSGGFLPVAGVNGIGGMQSSPNPLGAVSNSSNTINQVNNFPSGTNLQQAVNAAVGQILEAMG